PDDRRSLGQYPQVPGGAHRLRLRPHRDSVRHRRAGGTDRPRVCHLTAPDGIVEHVAAVHGDARGSRQAEAMSPSTVDVVVVGAGIAGLATAYELSRHGASFVVLERASRAGGVILSEEIDGYTIDGGPD